MLQAARSPKHNPRQAAQCTECNLCRLAWQISPKSLEHIGQQPWCLRPRWAKAPAPAPKQLPQKLLQTLLRARPMLLRCLPLVQWAASVQQTGHCR